MDFAPGTQVTDNVRLVELLGKGGMGSVWVADHLSLRTRVAVKFLSADLVKKDPTMRERFNREAELGAQIKSPHVVQIFDHGVMADSHPYIVMELMEGETLSQRLERERVLSLAHAKQVVVQTAKALSRAHKLGIVHRDIKPDNLFLISDEDEEIFVKILDFGIAKQTNLPKVSSVTGTGMMVGTPEYMSPEQVLSARSVDFRSDLWALGVVTYHCLTGGVPFSGETLGSLCVAIANGDFVPPSKYRRELPPGMDAWFLRALSKEAPDRFDSAKSMATEFAQLLGVPTESLASMSQPIVITPSNPGVRAISALAATTPVAARRPPLPIDDQEPTTGGVQLYTPAPAQQGPTFAGATLNRERGSRGKRRLAVVAVALAAAVAAAAAGMFFFPGPRETTVAAEPEPTTQVSAAEPSEPEAQPEPKPEPKAEPEPIVSAAASASVKPLAGRLPSPPPAKKTAPPAPKPSEAAPEPQPKDRGF